MAVQDLAGKTFGRLTVIKRIENHISPSGKMYSKWLCKCECGKYIEVLGRSLRGGHTQSCGCLQIDRTISSHTKHEGKSNGTTDSLYAIWDSMKQRCNNRNHKYYKDYGGRGISVCEEWSSDFSSFRKWAIENGYNNISKKYQCTIDRIDVNGNYEPSNCRWVDMKTQQRNRRNNVMIMYNGKNQCLQAWSDDTGLPFDTLWRRLKRGWDIDRALTTPLCENKSHRKEVITVG